MATYAPAPDLRLQFNEDGSAVYKQANAGGGILATATQGQMDALISESCGNAFAVAATERIGVLFPARTNVRGLFIANNGTTASNGEVRWSDDTTDGINGTWTTWTSVLPVPVVPSARNDIWRTNLISTEAVGMTNIRGITISSPSTLGSIRALHLYGQAGALAPTPWLYLSRLDSDPLRGADVDFGDAPRGASRTVALRVSNQRSGFIARSVIASLVALTPSSPTLASMTTFSADGVTFAAGPFNMGDQYPHTGDGRLYVRLAPTAAAQLSYWRQRIKLAATTWEPV